MIRRFALAALVVGVAIVGIAPRAFSQNATTGSPTFLWKVSAEGGGEIWLFGSIHAGTKDMYPLPDAVEKAFADSKNLVVEADIENVDAAGMQSLVFIKGLYPEGDSLSKHVKKETIEVLRDYCAKNGIPFEVMERMKPWLIGLTISAMAIQDLGMDPELGLDKHFLKAARTARKEVIEIEGIGQQLDIIASLSDADQEADLIAGLDDTDKSTEQIPQLLDAWKNGDADRIEEMSMAGLKAHPETKPAYENLLFKRNEKMAEKIEGYLKTKDSHFVVVGALHLVGEKGLVKLLEARKYRVEQIKRK